LLELVSRVVHPPGQVVVVALALALTRISRSPVAVPVGRLVVAVALNPLVVEAAATAGKVTPHAS
jgi:hypothetical protein